MAVWFAEEDGGAVHFQLRAVLRPGARQAIRALEAAGLNVEIVSGDSLQPVAEAARELGISTFLANQRPADKIAHLEELRARGRNVMMVGDGLNDAPALAAASVSMAPSSGSDVGRQAADFVFAGESLGVIPFCHRISLAADRLVRQNIAIAVVYNCIAVPLAMAGYVTPLVAAVAMSASSVVVVANSMRLKLRDRVVASTRGGTSARAERAVVQPASAPQLQVAMTDAAARIERQGT
jgi:Cu2+-exporting ATPase